MTPDRTPLRPPSIERRRTPRNTPRDRLSALLWGVAVLGALCIGLWFPTPHSPAQTPHAPAHARLPAAPVTIVRTKTVKVPVIHVKTITTGIPLCPEDAVAVGRGNYDPATGWQSYTCWATDDPNLHNGGTP